MAASVGQAVPCGKQDELGRTMHRLLCACKKMPLSNRVQGCQQGRKPEIQEVAHMHLAKRILAAVSLATLAVSCSGGAPSEPAEKGTGID
ncbi:hypothetical protein, partial [Erythrobacter donghaensis]|uniref:hypothetical protein n=1 Tax=Erythrobacter donghaensis TaxID=267135 RepID=UPI001E4CC49F